MLFSRMLLMVSWTRSTGGVSIIIEVKNWYSFQCRSFQWCSLAECEVPALCLDHQNTLPGGQQGTRTSWWAMTAIPTHPAVIPVTEAPPSSHKTSYCFYVLFAARRCYKAVQMMADLARNVVIYWRYCVWRAALSCYAIEAGCRPECERRKMHTLLYVTPIASYRQRSKDYVIQLLCRLGRSVIALLWPSHLMEIVIKIISTCTLYFIGGGDGDSSLSSQQ